MTVQSKDRWWLDDARVIAQQHPYSFWLPSKSVLERLMPGNHAKLVFCFESDNAEAPRAERVWVMIEELDGGTFKGSLDNEPKYMTQIRPGDRVTFETRHIIDTDIPDPFGAPYATEFSVRRHP
jgi:uncharacterized protein YegJ (DUF2314 family)